MVSCDCELQHFLPSFDLDSRMRPLEKIELAGTWAASALSSSDAAARMARSALLPVGCLLSSSRPLFHVTDPTCLWVKCFHSELLPSWPCGLGVSPVFVFKSFNPGRSTCPKRGYLQKPLKMTSLAGKRNCFLVPAGSILVSLAASPRTSGLSQTAPPNHHERCAAAELWPSPFPGRRSWKTGAIHGP